MATPNLKNFLLANEVAQQAFDKAIARAVAAERKRVLAVIRERIADVDDTDPKMVKRTKGELREVAKAIRNDAANAA